MRKLGRSWAYPRADGRADVQLVRVPPCVVLLGHEQHLGHVGCIGPAALAGRGNKGHHHHLDIGTSQLSPKRELSALASCSQRQAVGARHVGQRTPAQA